MKNKNLVFLVPDHVRATNNKIYYETVIKNRTLAKQKERKGDIGINDSLNIKLMSTIDKDKKYQIDDVEYLLNTLTKWITTTTTDFDLFYVFCPSALINDSVDTYYLMFTNMSTNDGYEGLIGFGLSQFQSRSNSS